jgi:hypothetical protein
MLRSTFIGITLVGIVALFGASAFSAELLSTEEMATIQGAANTCGEPHMCEGYDSCPDQYFLWYRCTEGHNPPYCSEYWVFIGCASNPGNKLTCSGWECVDPGK